MKTAERQFSYQFTAFMESVQITEKPHSFEISVKPDASKQNTVGTKIGKGTARGIALGSLLRSKENNAVELAAYLNEKVFLLDIPVYEK